MEKHLWSNTNVCNISASHTNTCQKPGMDPFLSPVQWWPPNFSLATKKPLHQNAWNPVEYFWVKIDQYSTHRNPNGAAKFPFPLFQTLCTASKLGNLIISHRCRSYGILGVNRCTCKALLEPPAPCKTRLPEDGAFQLQPHIVTGAHLATWGTMRAGDIAHCVRLRS